MRETAVQIRHVGVTSRFSLGRATVAGLAGSLVNTIAIHAVELTRVPPGTDGLAKLTLASMNRALHILGVNWRLPADFGQVGQQTFHTAIGVLMALSYAILFYSRLRGPGWLRGVLFCQLPWLIQVTVVLPWLGVGMLGWRLSPLTPVASFTLNALYGVTLGAVYTDRYGARAISADTSSATQEGARVLRRHLGLKSLRVSCECATSPSFLAQFPQIPAPWRSCQARMRMIAILALAANLGIGRLGRIARIGGARMRWHAWSINSLGPIDNLQIAATGLQPGKKYWVMLIGGAAPQELVTFSAGIGGAAIAQALGPLKRTVGRRRRWSKR